MSRGRKKKHPKGVLPTKTLGRFKVHSSSSFVLVQRPRHRKRQHWPPISQTGGSYVDPATFWAEMQAGGPVNRTPVPGAGGLRPKPPGRTRRSFPARPPQASAPAPGGTQATKNTNDPPHIHRPRDGAIRTAICGEASKRCVRCGTPRSSVCFSEIDSVTSTPENLRNGRQKRNKHVRVGSYIR